MIKLILKVLVYFLALVGLVFVAGTVYINYIASNLQEGELGFEIGGEYLGSYNFSNYIYFDYQVSNPGSPLPEPAEGSATLFGTILKDGVGVPDITLDVVLNGEFKKVDLRTDAAGRFSLSVEPGKWVVNAIVTKGWKGKPDGEFLVVAGNEPKYSDSSNYPDLDVEGLTHTVAANQEIEIVSMQINEVVNVTSPQDKSSKEVAEDFEIEWQPHTKAQFYKVVISSVTKLDNGSSYTPILNFKTEQTTAPLSKFSIVESEGKPKLYGVKVSAFDKDGNFVSESSPSVGENMFTLTDLRIVPKNELGLIDGEFSEAHYQSFKKNLARVEAAEALLDDNLISEAEKVIALIDEEQIKGTKAALTGYRLAKLGECDKAENWFKQAAAEGGTWCVKARYRKPCDLD